MKSIAEFIRGRLSVALIAGLLLPAAIHAAEPATVVPTNAEPVFAVVNGREISVRELDAAYQSALGQKFYHGAVPEGQAELVRREVAEALIERVLLEQEIARLEIKPDAIAVDKEVSEYDARYKDSPRWQQQRAQVLPGLKAQLEVRSQFDRLEKRLREVPAATPEEVRAYYDGNHKLFTEPEQVKLSVILLKVDPSAPKTVWDKAREEAQAIYQRLQKGADFADTARLHSGDGSAANGGDMGYMHRGMLPESVEALLNNFKVGATSEPITMLEGVALVRLDARKEAKLRAFEEVETRAGELLARARADQARKEAVARLHDAAAIEIKTPVDSAAAK